MVGSGFLSTLPGAHDESAVSAIFSRFAFGNGLGGGDISGKLTLFPTRFFSAKPYD